MGNAQMGETVPATRAFPALLLRCPLSKTSSSPHPYSKAQCSPSFKAFCGYARVESPFLLCSHGGMSHVLPFHLVFSYLSLKISVIVGARGGGGGGGGRAGYRTGTSSPGPSLVLGTQVAP